MSLNTLPNCSASPSNVATSALITHCENPPLSVTSLVVVVMSDRLHRTADQVTRWGEGFRAVTSAFPK